MAEPDPVAGRGQRGWHPFRRSAEPTPLDDWFALDIDEEAAWRDAVPGPSVDELAARLSSGPVELLDPRIDVIALTGDVLGPAAAASPGVAAAQAGDDSRAGVALGLWLVESRRLIGDYSVPLPDAVPPPGARLLSACLGLGLRLAPIVPPQRWLLDADRREEAVRLFLRLAGALPAGEDVVAARAQWSRVDSLARSGAYAEAMRTQERRLEVQRELASKRAAEAAARYTHE